MESYRRIFATSIVCALLVLLLVAVAPAALGQASTIPKRIIGDYGYWSKYSEPAYGAAQIPFDKLTHINHASVSMGSDGSVNVPEGFLEPELISGAHAARVKVLVLLGGDFSPISADPKLIPTLVTNLWTFITENGYDGIDIDWEYPGDKADRIAFVGLLQALREALPAPMYTISADVPPWGGNFYDFKASSESVDYLNIMTYDCAGPWTDDGQLNSPIFWDPSNPEPYECQPGGSVKQAISIYDLGNHIPLSKLNIGTPFYGYYYQTIHALFGNCVIAQQNGEDCPNVLSENYGTYFKQRVNQGGWITYYDKHALVPYMLRSDGHQNGYITYDDPFSTYSRVYYSDWTRGVGGTFMWSLDADYDGQSQDLLSAMYAATMKLPNPPQQ